MRSSRLAAVKTLETPRLTLPPSVNCELIEGPHERGFADHKESFVLLRPGGLVRLQCPHARSSWRPTRPRSDADRPGREAL